MSYVVYYKFCGGYHTEVFSEAEFEEIFEAVSICPSMSWMIV